MATCKICDASSTVIFSADVLGKYRTAYHQCGNCGFIQTDEPHWLSESYTSAINDGDLGPINRAVVTSKQIEGLLLGMFDKTAKFVDYGAGYGVLVRLMRDMGFDFYWEDPYCENIFAKHFVANPDEHYELLTAFEVFEHLADPIGGTKIMARYSDNIFFSTLLIPKDFKHDWWYLAPQHGQHVAFYTQRALEILGEKLGLHLCTDGVGTHLLSRMTLSNQQFRFFMSGRFVARIARKLLRRRLKQQTLLNDDMKKVAGYTIT